MSKSSTFLDVDPTLIENNLRIVTNPDEEEFNKLLAERPYPSKLVKPFPDTSLVYVDDATVSVEYQFSAILEVFERDTYDFLVSVNYSSVKDCKAGYLHRERFVELVRIFRENFVLQGQDSVLSVLTNFNFKNFRFCIKSKEVGTSKKVFINICQTDSIPPPKDISERELEEVLEAEDEAGFRIPMSIGEVHPDSDKNGEEVKVCDVAIHPTFFNKVEAVPLFKRFFLAVVFEGLKHKFSLHCIDDRIMLKNRKTFGNLQMHRIQQRDIDEKMGRLMKNEEKSVIGTNIAEESTSKKKLLIEELSSSTNVEETKPKIDILGGGDGTREPEYKLFTKVEEPDVLYGEFKLPDVASMKELTLDVGEDRIVLESKQRRYLLDIFIPYNVNNQTTTSKFNTTTKILTLQMPIKR